MRKKRNIETEQEIDAARLHGSDAVATTMENGQLDLSVESVNDIKPNEQITGVAAKIELVAASNEEQSTIQRQDGGIAVTKEQPSDAAVNSAAELLSPAQEVYEVVEEIDFLSEPEEVILTAGQMLTQARQKAGVDADNLAYVFKVSKKKIQALEADQFDQLPNLVFARCLASSICRYLKMDDSEVLNKMPSADGELGSRQDNAVERRGMLDLAQNTSIYMTTSHKNSKFKPLLLLLAAVVLLVAIYVLLPINIKDSWISSWQTSGVRANNTAEAAAPAPQPTNRVEPNTTEQLKTLD